MMTVLLRTNFPRFVTSPFKLENIHQVKGQNFKIRSIFKDLQLRHYSTSNSQVIYPLANKVVDMNEKLSSSYQALCTEYYELDKPFPPNDALSYYLTQAAQANGSLLEPMCGTGRFLIPLLKSGYDITGFDSSYHMLNLCQKKCKNEGLKSSLLEASFENFSSNRNYQLIFIPSGSFSLLTKPDQVTHALNTVRKYLGNNGKFIFEIDTLKSISEPQEVWKGHWIDKADGSKLVLNTFSRFDFSSSVNIILCRYELWEKNTITKTEVEDFRVRLYDTNEMDQLLKQHGFKIISKNIPYTNIQPDEKTESILYECVKE